MKAVATKEFVQSALDALRQEISNKIDDQTTTFQQAIREQNQAIREQNKVIHEQNDGFTKALKEQNDNFTTALKEQNDNFTTALKEQNADFTQSLKEQNDAIRALREKESRLRGTIDAVKYALPLIISIAAIIVAAFLR